MAGVFAEPCIWSCWIHAGESCRLFKRTCSVFSCPRATQSLLLTRHACHRRPPVAGGRSHWPMRMPQWHLIRVRCGLLLEGVGLVLSEVAISKLSRSLVRYRHIEVVTELGETIEVVPEFGEV